MVTLLDSTGLLYLKEKHFRVPRHWAFLYLCGIPKQHRRCQPKPAVATATRSLWEEGPQARQVRGCGPYGRHLEERAVLSAFSATAQSGCNADRTVP